MFNTDVILLIDLVFFFDCLLTGRLTVPIMTFHEIVRVSSFDLFLLFFDLSFLSVSSLYYNS